MKRGLKVRDLAAQHDSRVGVTGIDPMKRGLKVLKIPRDDPRIILVTGIDPMKRGLKGEVIDSNEDFIELQALTR